MKAIINEKETPVKDIVFPCLMVGKATGAIVMFLTEDKCLYITKNPDTVWNVGDINGQAKIVNFTPFTGSITISND